MLQHLWGTMLALSNTSVYPARAVGQAVQIARVMITANIMQAVSKLLQNCTFIQLRFIYVHKKAKRRQTDLHISFNTHTHTHTHTRTHTGPCAHHSFSRQLTAWLHHARCARRSSTQGHHGMICICVCVYMHVFLC